MEINIRKIVMFAILFALSGILMSGCAFLMKDYDDRNERKLAELSEKNKNLTAKVKNLERKVPGMDEEIDALGADHRNIKRQLSDLDGKLQGSDYTGTGSVMGMSQESSRTDAPAPAPAPEEKPFTLSSYDESASSYDESTPSKPAPQAKATLTEAGEKLLEMARQQESSGEKTTMEDMSNISAEPEGMTKPEEVMSEPEEMAEPEEIAEPEEMAEATSEAEAVKEPMPQPEQAANKSALTAEGARLLALARGEQVPSESSDEAALAAQESQEVIDRTPEDKSATEAQTEAQAVHAPQSVRLKVLSGTGNIVSARTMAKKLQGLGFKAEKKALAPRSNFTKNVVYHAKGYEQTAEDLKKALGEKTVIKSITWNSEFDIIVVSVE